MRRINWAAAGVLAGWMGVAGCHGPYRPTGYRNGDMPPMDYGVPVTEGPMLGNGATFPAPPGTMVMPGSVVMPGTPPSNPPIMPPAAGTPAPPLNTPPTGPMPRLTPTGQSVIRGS